MEKAIVVGATGGTGASVAEELCPTANEASYLGSTLEAIAADKMAFFIGNMRVPREIVYLPDAAFIIAELASRDDAYGQNWHIPGSGSISGNEIVHI